jgi:predicted nuclease with TOPRIM domain
VSGERVEFLEGTMAIREKELKDLEGDYSRIFEERNNFEKQYVEVVTELNELKAGRDSWINRFADILHKLFGGK